MTASWWHPDIHGKRRPALVMRSRFARDLRAWFDGEGFLEIDPNALAVSPGNEAHLHAVRADLTRLDGSRNALWLHTSPEFAMKKLLAAGEQKIFTLCKVYRDREASRRHVAEFTMLEWYRASASYQTLMDDCERLLLIAAESFKTRQFSFSGITCDPRLPAERLSVAQAFQRYTGIKLEAFLPGATDFDQFGRAGASLGIRIAPDDEWSDVFSKIVCEKIEPCLGIGSPTILYDYPLSEAALARTRPDDPRWSERFELYACGLELANAFGELTDVAEQRSRFEAEMALKFRLYGERYPLDEDFLSALPLMPEASGAALGFDRLVMLAAGASALDEIIWTPARS